MDDLERLAQAAQGRRQPNTGARAVPVGEFRIVGASRDNGADVEVTIEAMSRAAAEQWASQHGVLWTRIEPIAETVARADREDGAPTSACVLIPQQCKCGEQLPKAARYCPRCGAKFSPGRITIMAVLPFVVLAVIATTVMVLVTVLYSHFVGQVNVMIPVIIALALVGVGALAVSIYAKAAAPPTNFPVVAPPADVVSNAALANVETAALPSYPQPLFPLPDMRSGGTACHQCGGLMVKKTLSSGNCGGIAVAMLTFCGGLLTLLIPVVGCFACPVICGGALFMGGKRQRVWRCVSCGSYVPRA